METKQLEHLRYVEQNARGSRYACSFRLFDSVAHLVRFAGTASGEHHWNVISRKSSFVGRDFADFAAVEKAVNEPWPEGMDLLEKFEKKLEDEILPQPADRRRIRSWSDFDGDDICIDRLRAGAPFWDRRVRKQVQAPESVSIVCDIGENAGVSPGRMFWKGAAAIFLAKTLETAGYAVDLWGNFNAYNSRSGPGRIFDFSYMVRLKRPGAPLDTDLLAKALSGWFFRTVGFHAIGADSGKRTCRGLGRHGKPVKRIVERYTLPMTYYIENVLNEEAAVDWAREALMDFAEESGYATF